MLLAGRVIAKEEALVSPLDRGFTCGDGVFTTILVENGKPIFFHAHQKRLREHAKELKIQAPFIAIKLIEELIVKNSASQGKFRLKILISGGQGPIGFDQRRPGFILAYLQPYETKTQPLSITIYPFPFEHPGKSMKTLAYLPRFMIHDWTRAQGFDECIITNASKIVLEGTFSNIFWVIDKRFYYPDPKLHMMQGITLLTILKIVRKLGYILQPVCVDFHRIPKEANLFLCNALMGFIPVENVDHLRFHRSPLFERELHQEYEHMKSIY